VSLWDFLSNLFDVQNLAEMGRQPRHHLRLGHQLRCHERRLPGRDHLYREQGRERKTHYSGMSLQVRKYVLYDRLLDQKGFMG